MKSELRDYRHVTEAGPHVCLAFHGKGPPYPFPSQLGTRVISLHYASQPDVYPQRGVLFSKIY